MRRLLPILLLLALALPASASAQAPANGPVTWDGTAWHYANERPAHNAMLDQLVARSATWWAARGHIACPNPQVMLAPNLGPNVQGRTDIPQCRMWFLPDDVGAAQRRPRPFAWDLCGYVLHEVGHTTGAFEHLPGGHSEHGVMSPGANMSEDPAAEAFCNRWERHQAPRRRRARASGRYRGRHEPASNRRARAGRIPRSHR